MQRAQADRRCNFVKFDEACYNNLVLRLVQIWNKGDAVSDGQGIKALHAFFVFVISEGLLCVLAMLIMLISVEQESPMKDETMQQQFGMSKDKIIRALLTAATGTHPTLPGALAQSKGLRSECAEQAGVRYLRAYDLFIWIWFVSVFGRFRNQIAWIYHVSQVKSRSSTRKGLFNEEGTRVKYLDGWMRAILIFFIGLPKLLIIIGVGYAGATFLMLTTHPSLLVTKVLILQWLFLVDNMILRGLTPDMTIEEIQNVSLQTTDASLEAFPETTWQAGRGGFVWLLITACSALLFVHYQFAELMAFRRGCMRYIEMT